MDPAQSQQNQQDQPVATLADDIEDFEEAQHDYQAMYNAGGHFKEQLEAITKSWRVESGEWKVESGERVEEILTSPEVEKHLEVDGYVEKVEKEAELAQPVVDDYTNQILINSPASQNPKITLPLTEEEIEKGLHHKVWESIRWLAEWCARQMKILRLDSRG